MTDAASEGLRMIDALDTPPRPGLRLVAEPDESLARRAGRDPDAFTELYRRYLPRIYAYCHARLGNREAAEDATSQVFTNAYAALPRFRADNLRAWLFTIAHHVVTDVYRQRGSPVSLDLAAEAPDTDPGPEQHSVTADTSAELRRAIVQLSPDQQRVVELRLAGLTGPEIRTVLGKSRSWVDTTQHRAVKRLRLLLPQPPSSTQTVDALAKETPYAPS